MSKTPNYHSFDSIYEFFGVNDLTQINDDLLAMIMTRYRPWLRGCRSFADLPGFNEEVLWNQNEITMFYHNMGDMIDWIVENDITDWAVIEPRRHMLSFFFRNNDDFILAKLSEAWKTPH